MRKRGSLIQGNVVAVDNVVDLRPYDPYVYLEVVHGEVDRSKPIKEYFGSLLHVPKVPGTYVTYVGGSELFLEGMTTKEVASELGIELINQAASKTEYLRANSKFSAAADLMSWTVPSDRLLEAEVVVAVIKSPSPESISGCGRLLKLTAEFEGKPQKLLVISGPK